MSFFKKKLSETLIFVLCLFLSFPVISMQERISSQASHTFRRTKGKRRSSSWARERGKWQLRFLLYIATIDFQLDTHEILWRRISCSRFCLWRTHQSTRCVGFSFSWCFCFVFWCVWKPISDWQSWRWISSPPILLLYESTINRNKKKIIFLFDSFKSPLAHKTF